MPKQKVGFKETGCSVGIPRHNQDAGWSLARVRQREVMEVIGIWALLVNSELCISKDTSNHM